MSKSSGELRDEVERDLPTFLYVGAGRSGSTFLYKVAKAHPEIFVPSSKDLYFFDRNFDLGSGWYRGQFSGGATFKARGEFTMDYFLDPKVAGRIAAIVPETRIICCLREPVSRAFSHYFWEMLTFHNVSRKEYRDGLSFETFARRADIFRYGDYYGNLLPYYECFPRDHILVLFYDDLLRDPESMVRRFLRFVGVDDSVELPDLTEKVNPARVPRWPLVAELGYKLGNHLRSSGKPGILSRLRDDPLFNRMMFKPIAKDREMLAEAWAALWPLYHRNDAALSDLIDQPVPPGWRFDAGPA